MINQGISRAVTTNSVITKAGPGPWCYEPDFDWLSLLSKSRYPRPLHGDY